MPSLSRFFRDLSARRTQHLVFLIHVWACAPFLVFWLSDPHVQKVLGVEAVHQLRPVVSVTVAYLLGRTYLAFKDPPRLRWEYVFPPIDVALISLILYLSHRGPMSNITLLFFLPIVSASGSLNVRWAAGVGLMVVLGTAIAAWQTPSITLPPSGMSAGELLKAEPLNVAFRLYFLVVISSLMAYQALIAAELREQLGVSADRNRIAMDMHDGVQGHLITMASQLELIARVAETDGARAAEIAQEGREMARQAADELRFLVQRLRSPSLSDGFVPALRQYAHNICERNGLQMVFSVEGQEWLMEPEAEGTLFRIAQESLNNVAKHSQAKTVSINVRFMDDQIKLDVQDDGKGFDGEAASGCYGLEGMKERATKAHGSVMVKSQVGAGTDVVATLPRKIEHV